MSSCVDQPVTTSKHMNIHAGMRWNALSAWGTQAVQLGVSIVLARLLAPQDYGVLAMATVFLGFLNLFRTMGFSAVIVQRPNIDNRLLDSLFYTNFAVACLLAILAFAAGPLCTWIYGDIRVAQVLAVLGLNFILTACAVVPSALLTRQLKFDRLALANVAATLLSGVTSILLALAGWGVWSLVAGAFVKSLIDTGLCHLFCSWHPTLMFDWSEVRSVVRFGTHVTGFNFFNYFSRNADSAIIGKFLDASCLGFYSLALGIMIRPLTAVTNVIGTILFPALSKTQDNDARFRTTYLRACGAIAFVTFPMMLGLAAVAVPFVHVVLGKKWLPAVPVILALAPLGAVQSVGETAKQIFLAKGRSDCYLWWGVGTGVAYVVCFLAGLPWGITGVAWAYLTTGSAMTVLGLWIASRLVDDLTLRDLGATIRPHVVNSVVMALLVRTCVAAMEDLGVSPPLVLVVSVLSGIIVYILLTLAIKPPAFYDLIGLIPGLNGYRQRRSAQQPSECSSNCQQSPISPSISPADEL